MQDKEIYLDNSATTRVAKTAVDIMVKIMQEDYGNPSSLHKKGMMAEKILKAARSSVANVLGVKTEEIFFTSGGTESNNTVFEGIAKQYQRQGRHIITTVVEHPSVLNACHKLEQKGYEVTYLPVNHYGVVEIEDFAQELREDTILVSMMHVNNETGAVMPINQIKQIAQKKGYDFLFHVDAVQSFGKLEINVKKWGIDFLAASGHKLHGPKGVGFLYKKKEVILNPLLVGGGQEKDLRSGTENMPGIVGLEAATKMAIEKMEKSRIKVMALNQHLATGIRAAIPEAVINSYPEKYGMPYVLNVSFPGFRSEVLLHSLENKGIYVSSGSACSSHKKKFSHVLEAMGLTPVEMEGALRFSFSRYNTKEEIDFVIEKLAEVVSELKFFMGRA